MTHPDLPPDPFTPGLPRVGQEAIEAVHIRSLKDNGLIAGTLLTLSVEQPDLTGALVESASKLSGGDEEEQIRIMSVFAYGYLLLEQQRQLDEQS